MSACAFDQRDLCFVRGDTGRIDVALRDRTGASVSLVGATLFLTVKNALTDADSAAVIRKEVTAHDDAAGGLSHFDLATTDNATAGSRFYDIQLKTSAGEIGTISGGLWRVLSDVTIRTAPLA
jgi:hypothetical protein